MFVLLICNLRSLSTGIIAFTIIDVLFSRMTSLLCVISTLAFNIFIALLKEFTLFASTKLKYAIHLNINLSTFPTLWAVLSTLLDTQDGNLEYIKFLQKEYNTYYADKSRKYMVNLETKSIEIQNHMHDSVTHDFDRVSDFNDNGSTPLQGQQDEQPEGINRAENAIDNDVVDIMTLYPSW